MGDMNERAGRFYDIPAQERDRRIVELKRRGWTLKKIAKQVGMTESGIRHALTRIAGGGYGAGQPPR